MIENRLSGHFTLSVHNADGSVKDTHEFKNLITDYGMNQIGAVPSPSMGVLFNCQVGTGSTTPAVGDTTLSAFRALAAQNGGPSHGYNEADDYHWRRWSYRFDQGAAAGNLTEIGIGWSGSTQGNLFSRALILDTNGAPTVLVIAANEFLTVTYELRNYPKHGDTVTTAMIDGVERTITIRPCQVKSPGNGWADNLPSVNAYSGGQSTAYDGVSYYTSGIAAEDGMPSGGNGNLSQTSRVWSAYVPGSFRRECVSTVSINQANMTIRSAVLATGIGKWQYEFAPPIVKDNTMELRCTLAVAWSRYTP